MNSTATPASSLRAFALGLGVDDFGIAAAKDYISPNSPPIDSLLPGVRSILVLAFRELSSCAGPDPISAMNARLDLTAFTRSVGYKLARHIEQNWASATVSIPVAYPMDFRTPEKIGKGALSLRHAAVAAGLGTFGRHNLVVHPRFGTRVLFTALLTELELGGATPLTENPCTGCNQCVRACPAHALEVEGRTEIERCMAVSQPYGMRANIGFWTRLLAAAPEERAGMLASPEHLSLSQAASLGLQYYCFRCLSSCPVGVRRTKAEQAGRNE